MPENFASGLAQGLAQGKQLQQKQQEVDLRKQLFDAEQKAKKTQFEFDQLKFQAGLEEDQRARQGFSDRDAQAAQGATGGWFTPEQGATGTYSVPENIMQLRTNPDALQGLQEKMAIAAQPPVQQYKTAQAKYIGEGGTVEGWLDLQAKATTKASNGKGYEPRKEFSERAFSMGHDPKKLLAAALKGDEKAMLIAQDIVEQLEKSSIIEQLLKINTFGGAAAGASPSGTPKIILGNAPRRQ